MAAQQKGSTPATTLLRDRGVEFAVHEFAHAAGERNYALVAAEGLGIAAERVFKTLLAGSRGCGRPASPSASCRQADSSR